MKPCPPPSFLRSAVLLLMLAGASFAWRYDIMIVSGDSMAPTFANADLLVVDTRAYDRANPLRGDILVARRPCEFIVKRVVGLPSEEVEVQAGYLVINGRMVVEPYPVETGSLWIAKGRLGQGRYAIVGDNRGMPVEQAMHGVIGKEDIVGRVRFSLGLGSITRAPASLAFARDFLGRPLETVTR